MPGAYTEARPLRAACDTLWGTVVTFSYGRRHVLFAALEQTCPALRTVTDPAETQAPPENGCAR